MFFKKLVFTLIILSAIFCFSSGFSITMKPNYSEERFQPTDKFHSTCLESAEFYLQTNNQELQEINIKINYDP